MPHDEHNDPPVDEGTTDEAILQASTEAITIPTLLVNTLPIHPGWTSATTTEPITAIPASITYPTVDETLDGLRYATNPEWREMLDRLRYDRSAAAHPAPDVELFDGGDGELLDEITNTPATEPVVDDSTEPHDPLVTVPGYAWPMRQSLANQWATQAPPEPAVVTIADLNIPEIWRSRDRYYDSMAAFRREIGGMIAAPSQARAIQPCWRCNIPDLPANQTLTSDGHSTCTPCLAYLSRCEDCNRCSRENIRIEGDAPPTLCRGCAGSRLAFCSQCGVFYDSADQFRERIHRHDGTSCCESPQTEFSIRNGDSTLANDTRLTLSHGEGLLSDEGMTQVFSLMRDVYRGRHHAEVYTDQERNGIYYALNDLEGLGREWTTKDGTWPKRLKRMVYKQHSVAIKPALLTEVGNLVKQHSVAINFDIETTRLLNLSAEDFCHGESCWWQSYQASRCLLKTNGGFGIRTFDEDNYPVGRVWVMPMMYDGSRRSDRRFSPTFETLNPDAYMVFNGYGNLGGYAPVKMLGAMTGLVYRKIDDFYCPPMYTNNGSGYLLSTPEIIAATEGWSRLQLRCSIHSPIHADWASTNGPLAEGSATTTENTIENGTPSHV